MSFDVRDAIIGGVSSNCCGAAVLLGDMCADCGEHCEAENDEPTETELERYNERAFELEEQRVLREDREARELIDAGRGHLVR